MWPGDDRIPSMGTGATDSRWLRAAGIPVYGVSGLFLESRAAPTAATSASASRTSTPGAQFLHRLIRELATAQ